MSPEAWITLISAVIGGLFTLTCLICAAAWWMSALYSRVGHIQTNTQTTNTKLDTLTERVDGDVRDLRHDVTDLQIRMVQVEGQVDTEAE